MPIIVDGDSEGPVSPARYETSALVDEVLMTLSGFTIDMGQVTWLTQDIGASTRSIMVDTTVGLSRGIAEIGDELIYVSSVSEGTLNISPTGRGYRGTTAQAHSAGDEVLFGPRFPRHQVLREINDVIENSYPMIWGMGEVEFTINGVQRLYELPSEAQEVKVVEWRPITPTEVWEPISRFRFYHNAPSNMETGKAIELPHVQTGRTVRVRYTLRPKPLTAASTFSDSNLNESAWPAIKNGALHRLVSGLTLGHLEQNSAQAAEYNRAGGKPLAVELSREYYALYQQFLAEERSRLLKDNRPRVSYRR